MEYMLLIYKENEFHPEEGSEEYAGFIQAHNNLHKDLRANGRYIGSNPLEPTSAATTVRLKKEKVEITDGPFAETREQLAGYYLVECESLDEAMDIAVRIPCAATGSVEIRPLQRIKTMN